MTKGIPFGLLLLVTSAVAAPPSKVVVAPGCGVAGKRCPALMVFGGFENAGRVLELFQTDTRVVLASFDYPFAAPRKLTFPDGLRHAPALKRMVGETVDGIRALARELAERPDVDPRRIVVVGASLGAPFVTLAAADCPEISGVALVEGFGDVPGTAMHQLVRKWEPGLGPLARPLAWLLAQAGWWYVGARDPEAAASRFSERQTVLMITARGDRFVPARSSDALWAGIEASRARRRRVFVEGDHVQPGSDVRGLIAEIERWLASERLLTAEEAGGVFNAYAKNLRSASAGHLADDRGR